MRKLILCSPPGFWSALLLLATANFDNSAIFYSAGSIAIRNIGRFVDVDAAKATDQIFRHENEVAPTTIFML